MKTNFKSRVVIDTNVVISALVFGGKPRQILELVADRTISVYLAEELLTELRRKITSKFPDFAVDLEKYERLINRDGIVVKLGLLQVRVSQDSNDDMFLETAMLGKCDCIISGDKDLLVLKEYEGIKIATASEFLSLYENM